MDPILLGSGILTWSSTERRSGRYGSIALADRNFNQDVTVEKNLDLEAVRTLEGSRVRLVAIVEETRQSGHQGDRFLEIYPSTPELGEEITIGVGSLFFQASDWSDQEYCVGLFPQDGRDELWLDPRILYRLHDQTVRLMAIPTNEPDHLAPDLQAVCENGVISNGDGSFQYRSKKRAHADDIRVLPNVTSHGDGLFSFTRPSAMGNEGEFYKLGE